MSAKWERDSDASKGTLTFDIDVDTINSGRAVFLAKSSTKCTVKNPFTKML